MNRLLIAAALGATALGGIAYAQPGMPQPTPDGGEHPHRGHGDMNGDGVMTRAEFMARAGQRFDRMDTNHDGKIDATERQAMGGHHGKGQRGMGNQGMEDMPPPPPPPPPPGGGD